MIRKARDILSQQEKLDREFKVSKVATDQCKFIAGTLIGLTVVSLEAGLSHGFTLFSVFEKLVYSNF